MTHTFHTRILAGVTALALGIGGLAASPAQAGSDTARIIGGLAALAIIGAAIADRQDDRRRAVTRHGHRGQGYGYGRHRGYGHGRHGYARTRHYRHNHLYRRGRGYRHDR